MSFPFVEWRPIEGVTYNGYPVYRHPLGELAYDTAFQLVTLPPAVEAAIQSGVKGDLHD